MPLAEGFSEAGTGVAPTPDSDFYRNPDSSSVSALVSILDQIGPAGQFPDTLRTETTCDILVDWFNALSDAERGRQQIKKTTTQGIIRLDPHTQATYNNFRRVFEMSQFHFKNLEPITNPSLAPEDIQGLTENLKHQQIIASIKRGLRALIEHKNTLDIYDLANLRTFAASLRIVQEHNPNWNVIRP